MASLPFKPLREAAQLHTCPLKFCLQKLLAAHELLSQTLHPHRRLQQTLMQSCILLLKNPDRTVTHKIKNIFHDITV